VYKSVIHRVIWFPYRPEQALLGPLLLAFLFLVASTGAIKAIDIFTSFGSAVAGHEVRITLLVLLLCLVTCIIAARSDYISVVAAVVPCIVTVVAVTALSLIGTWPKSGASAAVLQASVSSFVALSLIGRLVQSGGPDLGAIGVYWRHLKRGVRAMKVENISAPHFKSERAALVRDAELLAKGLNDAAPHLIDPNLCEQTAKCLDSFVAFSAMASHSDFYKAVKEGPQSLARALEKLNQGLT